MWRTLATVMVGSTLISRGRPVSARRRWHAAGKRNIERGDMGATSPGAVLEREFAFGVVRQLFERVRRTSDPDERSRLFGGPARAAGALLGASRPPDLRDESRSFAYLHGLHGLLVNLAGGPHLHRDRRTAWADAASLRWFELPGGSSR